MWVMLTLLPSDLSEGHDLPPGATIMVADCGHRAWISPSGAAALVQNPTLPTVCGDCAGPHVQAATDLLRRHQQQRY